MKTFSRWTLPFFALIWTLLVGISLHWSYDQIERSMLALAEKEAHSCFNKDIIYRLWNTRHGGVYVPSTAQTPPNPYLDHIPERNITTPSGVALTLINPAYMTRQVHELGLERYSTRSHITSLNPIRPENAPDPWETEALQGFEAGIEKVVSIETMDGQPYLRSMYPLTTEKGCLKCHAMQGYQEGDIRGGISVSVPLTGYRQVATANQRPMVLGHIAIWLLGLGVMLSGALLLRRAEQARQTEFEHQERRKMDERLQQARNLESLGVLAGGIAHDFNNILAAIMGNAELAIEGLSPPPAIKQSLIEILEASKRAAGLSRQMMAYSGKGDLQKQEIVLGQLVEDAYDTLETVVRKKSILSLHIGEDTACICADPAQIRQVLLSLVINASEALADGNGNITIATGVADTTGEISPNDWIMEPISPGAQAYMAVSDTGHGIEPQKIHRIFEPFFTTKSTGRGLGLSAVVGIVRSHSGTLLVHSVPGEGTTFKVLFPMISSSGDIKSPDNTGNGQGSL